MEAAPHDKSEPDLANKIFPQETLDEVREELRSYGYEDADIDQYFERHSPQD